MDTEVTTYYLEMTSPAQLRPARFPSQPFAVRRAQLSYPALNRFFYEEVGRAHHWTDRLAWTEEEWRSYLNRKNLQTWIGYVCETPAGYFELEKQEADVQLVYFGLLPPFIGQGIGGALLTAAIGRAWAMDTQRVWVHTCTIDHPAALHNYQKRGFRIYDQQTHKSELPTA